MTMETAIENEQRAGNNKDDCHHQDDEEEKEEEEIQQEPTEREQDDLSLAVRSIGEWLHRQETLYPPDNNTTGNKSNAVSTNGISSNLVVAEQQEPSSENGSKHNHIVIPAHVNVMDGSIGDVSALGTHDDVANNLELDNNDTHNSNKISNRGKESGDDDEDQGQQIQVIISGLCRQLTSHESGPHSSEPEQREDVEETSNHIDNSTIIATTSHDDHDNDLSQNNINHPREASEADDTTTTTTSSSSNGEDYLLLEEFYDEVGHQEQLLAGKERLNLLLTGILISVVVLWIVLFLCYRFLDGRPQNQVPHAAETTTVVPVEDENADAGFMIETAHYSPLITNGFWDQHTGGQQQQVVAARTHLRRRRK